MYSIYIYGSNNEIRTIWCRLDGWYWWISTKLHGPMGPGQGYGAMALK